VVETLQKQLQIVTEVASFEIIWMILAAANGSWDKIIN